MFFFITKYRKRRRNTFCHNDDVVLTLAHFSEILPVVIEAACSKFISLGENKQVRNHVRARGSLPVITSYIPVTMPAILYEQQCYYLIPGNTQIRYCCGCGKVYHTGIR